MSQQRANIFRVNLSTEEAGNNLTAISEIHPTFWIINPANKITTARSHLRFLSSVDTARVNTRRGSDRSRRHLADYPRKNADHSGDLNARVGKKNRVEIARTGWPATRN